MQKRVNEPAWVMAGSAVVVLDQPAAAALTATSATVLRRDRCFIDPSGPGGEQ